MRFDTRILLSAVLPALLFILGLAGGIGGLLYTKQQFGAYVQTEQRISTGLTEMYAQGKMGLDDLGRLVRLIYRQEPQDD